MVYDSKYQAPETLFSNEWTFSVWKLYFFHFQILSIISAINIKASFYNSFRKENQRLEKNNFG